MSEIRNHLTTKPASIVLIEEAFLWNLIKYDLHTALDDSLTPNRGMGTYNRLAGGRVYPEGWTNVPRESQSPSRPLHWSQIDVLVDVRDVADAHVLALTTEDAGGQRFVLAAQNFQWQDVCE